MTYSSMFIMPIVSICDFYPWYIISYHMIKPFWNIQGLDVLLFAYALTHILTTYLQIMYKINFLSVKIIFDIFKIKKHKCVYFNTFIFLSLKYNFFIKLIYIIFFIQYIFFIE